MSRDVKLEISDVLDSNVISDRHSYYQLKYFLIGKEPTHQAKLWRCIRELKARKESLESMSLEIEDMEDNKKLIDIQLQKINNNVLTETLDIEEKKIQIRQLERKRISIDRKIKDINKKYNETTEEACFFIDAFRELEKLETLKPFDDIKVQEQYWDNKLLDELNYKIILGRPIEVDLAKTILSLKDGAIVKKEFIGIINESKSKAMQKK